MVLGIYNGKKGGADRYRTWHLSVEGRLSFRLKRRTMRSTTTICVVEKVMEVTEVVAGVGRVELPLTVLETVVLPLN